MTQLVGSLKSRSGGECNMIGKASLTVGPSSGSCSTKFNYVKHGRLRVAKAGPHKCHLSICFIYAGMIVIDADGKIGCGMTTNGASHKIPG